MGTKKILFLLFCISALLYGQSDDEWTSRLLMVRSLAETDDREQKLMALTEADRLLSESPSDSEKGKALEILAFLASEGVTNITYEGISPGKRYGTVRTVAAELLGRYGGEESIPPLIDILFYDDDPTAIGSAAAAAVEIEAENKGNVVLAFSRILKNTRKVYNNERLIQEILISVGKWAEKDPDILLNEDLADGLNFCSQGESGYGRTTRNMALDLIRTASLKENATS